MQLVLGYADYPRAIIGAARRRADFAGVERFCLFLGYPRSGHTLPGAMLNAHPNALIAHELDALQYVDMGFGRDALFSLLVDRDQWFCRRGCEWTGYSYTIPNQSQGRTDGLRVIGDKKGAGTARRLGRNPALLERLRRTVEVPLRLIHVTRNPFDNIATIAARRSWSVEEAARTYFSLCDAVAGTLRRCDSSEVLHLRHEDMIAAPVERLQGMCQFVGIVPSRSYLADCAGIVFASPSKSRTKAGYSAEQRASIEARQARYEFLRGYTYDS